MLEAAEEASRLDFVRGKLSEFNLSETRAEYEPVKVEAEAEDAFPRDLGLRRRHAEILDDMRLDLHLKIALD